MTTLTRMEEKGTAAVRKLRIQKLLNGHPFMINSKELISNQGYLEYPDGTIKLVSITYKPPGILAWFGSFLL